MTNLPMIATISTPTICLLMLCLLFMTMGVAFAVLLTHKVDLQRQINESLGELLDDMKKNGVEVDSEH